MGKLDQERIERERVYHNERFTEETRDHQEKYYSALRDLNHDYEASILRHAAGADVLEYGCAKGEMSVRVAPVAKTLAGIDISDVAVAAADEVTKAAGYNNCSFSAMNAEAMTFPDNSFDLVFGSGILHHLDLDRAFGELARVLRPGGKCIFKEPLGHNIIINAYRALTPSARTPDEHPMLKGDFDIARRYFGDVELEFYGLTTLACVPLRNTAFAEAGFRVTSSLDKLLFSVPGMRWQAWYTLISMDKNADSARVRTDRRA